MGPSPDGAAVPGPLAMSGDLERGGWSGRALAGYCAGWSWPGCSSRAACRIPRCTSPLARSSSSEACSSDSRALSAPGRACRNFIQLALGGCLLACLGVLDDEDHGEGQCGDQGLEDGFLPAQEPHGQAQQNPRQVRG
jgi:hypothetical protein